MIKQIKFVSIPVADQNRALDFYTEKLGFTIITDQPFDQKQRWIELRIPKAETRVVLFTAEGEEKRIGSMMPLSFACTGGRRKSSRGAATPCSRIAKATVSSSPPRSDASVLINTFAEIRPIKHSGFRTAHLGDLAR